MSTNIKYILLTALRDWLFPGLMIGVIAATLVSHVLAGTAMVEAQEMNLSFAGAAARLIINIGLIVFVCFHLRHAFDSKEIDVIVSRPISRPSLVFSYWLGFAVVALLLVIPALAVISCVGILSIPGFVGWGISLLAETFLVIALALFASFTLRSAVTSVIASLGFYVLARMMGFFVATTQSRIAGHSLIDMTATHATTFISMIIPRLDFFAKTEWLVYGFSSSQEYWLFLLQAAIYVPLLLVAAIIDFNRKQF